MTKQYLSAQTLLNDAFALALDILADDYIPDLLIGVWRGGSPVAIAVHEIFHTCGHNIDHTVIRARSYKGIDQQTDVSLASTANVISEFPHARRLLVVDDVFDTGRTLKTIVSTFRNSDQFQESDIRIAAPYYKPGRNQVEFTPDYHLHETENWLVFPHEMYGLSIREVSDEKPDLSEPVRKRLLHELQLNGKC